MHARFGAGIAVGCLVAVASGVAWSAPLPSGRVALLEAPEASPTARHCVTRIRDELASGGFQVALVDPGPSSDPVSLVAAMHAQEGAVAVIALLGDPDRPGAELLILDRIGATAEIRRIPIPKEDPDHVPEVLAIRTMELLRASALKTLVEATRSRQERPPPAMVAPAETRPPAAAATRPIGVEAGLSVLDSLGGPGAAALPIGRARAWLGDRVFARLTVAGLGSRPRIETSIGSASVSQSVGLAELALALRPGARWRPTFSLGAGALYVHTDGDGVFPYEGVGQTRWVTALDAGIGLLASVQAHVSLAFEIHALVAVPHPTVRFYDIDGGTVAFPAVLASFTMVVWL